MRISELRRYQEKTLFDALIFQFVLGLAVTILEAGGPDTMPVWL